MDGLINPALAIRQPEGPEWIMNVSPDGTVTFNPDLKPDEAGKAAFDVLMGLAKQWSVAQQGSSGAIE